MRVAELRLRAVPIPISRSDSLQITPRNLRPQALKLKRAQRAFTFSIWHGGFRQREASKAIVNSAIEWCGLEMLLTKWEQSRVLIRGVLLGEIEASVPESCYFCFSSDRRSVWALHVTCKPKGKAQPCDFLFCLSMLRIGSAN
jgi:hypothetical protein